MMLIYITFAKREQGHAALIKSSHFIAYKPRKGGKVRAKVQHVRCQAKGVFWYASDLTK